MFRSCVLAACAALLFASNAFAQCGANGTGQCGAPSAASLSASQQLAQLQLNNGLAASSSAASSAVPTFTPSPQFVQAAPQFYAPQVAAYAGYAGALQPGMVFVQLPAPSAAAPIAAVAPESSVVAQQPVNLFQLAAFPGAAASSGSSAAASASASAPVVAPTPVVVPTTAAVGGCASGNCGARAGLLSRLGSRGGLLGQRSSSRSVSISRSRVR